MKKLICLSLVLLLCTSLFIGCGNDSTGSNLTKVTFNNDDVVSIDVTVDVIYGYSVPDVAFDIQQCVRHNVESMSKYKVDKVDVHVNSVAFEEEQA